MVAQWTEAYSSWTPSGTSWVNYDIYTNLSVPKGAIAKIAIQYAGTATTTDVGVRTDGSSLSRYIRVCPLVYTGGNSTTVMYVKVDSSTGIIETYCSTTTSVTFFLLGYWTGVDFTEQWTSCMPGSGSAWTDVNLNSVASVPANRVASILLGNKEAAANTLGARRNGSSVDRFLPIRNSVTAGCHRCLTMQVQTDSSGIVELYSTDTSNTSVYCTGYFDNNLFYVDNLVTGPNLTGTSWTDWDISANLDRDTRVADIVVANSRNGSAVYTLGSRINGSALTRSIVCDRGDGTGYSYCCFPTGTDSSGILELITSNATYEYIRFLGYYKEAVTQANLTKTSDARLKKLDNTLTKTSDARIAAAGPTTKSVTATSDARLKKADITQTKTSDARLKKEVSTTKTSDARLKKTFTVGTPSNWGYKTRIPINYSSDGSQTDYQMKLTIYSGSGTNSAGVVYLNSHSLNWPYDILFENATGDTLPHYRESYDASSQTVWVQTDSIASSGTTDFYLFYGDSGASDESNIDDTFPFADDFNRSDSGTVGNSWTEDENGYTLAISSNTLQVQGDNNKYCHAQKSCTLPSNFCIEFSQSISYGISATWASRCWAYWGTQSWVGLGQMYPNGVNYEKKCIYNISGSPSDGGITNGAASTFYRMRLRFDSSNVYSEYLNGSTWTQVRASFSRDSAWSGSPSLIILGKGFSQTTTYPNADLDNDYATAHGNDQLTYYDFVLVRKYTTNEPTWATPDSESSVSSLPTSDAKLIWVRTVTKTSDANLYSSGPTTHDVTINSNAQLKKLDNTLTKPSDARLKKVDLILTKPSDARIKKPDNSTTKSSDARIKKPDNILTKNSNARIKKADITLTKASDARLKKLDNVLTKNSNAKLVFYGTLTKLSDARLKKIDNILTKTSSATLEREVVVTKTSDARLKKLDNTLTKLSNARLLKIGTATKTSDARLKKLDNTLTKTSDAMISGGSSVGISSNARLKKLDNTLTKSSDARLLKIGTLTKTSAAKLVIYGTITKLSDARIKKADIIVTKSSDARIKKLDNSTTKTSDARLKKADITFSTYSNAQLKKLGIIITKTSDAYITAGMIVGSITKSSDARLKKLDNTLTKSSDARLLKVGTTTKTSNATFKYTKDITITSNASLKKVSSFDIYSNARLYKSSTTRVQIIIVGC